MIKNLFLFAAIAVLASTQAAEAAKKGSEQDITKCECSTCLIKNGICVTTQKPRQPIKKDGGGAVKSKTR